MHVNGIVEPKSIWCFKVTVDKFFQRKWRLMNENSSWNIEKVGLYLIVESIKCQFGKCGLFVYSLGNHWNFWDNLYIDSNLNPEFVTSFRFIPQARISEVITIQSTWCWSFPGLHLLFHLQHKSREEMSWCWEIAFFFVIKTE